MHLLFLRVPDSIGRAFMMPKDLTALVGACGKRQASPRLDNYRFRVMISREATDLCLPETR